MREFKKSLCGKGSRKDSRRHCNGKPAEVCLVPVKTVNAEERMGHCGLLKRVKVKYELHWKQKTGGPPKHAFIFPVQCT